MKVTVHGVNLHGLPPAYKPNTREWLRVFAEQMRPVRGSTLSAAARNLSRATLLSARLPSSPPGHPLAFRTVRRSLSSLSENPRCPCAGASARPKACSGVRSAATWAPSTRGRPPQP